MKRGLATLAFALLCGPAAADSAGPMDIETRESALAATVDMEFQDAMPDGVGGAVVLEQDGKLTLLAGYGYADAGKTTPFLTDARAPTGIVNAASISADWYSSAEEIYHWFRSARVQDDLRKNIAPSSAAWDFRKADDGHVVQVSHKGQNGVFLSYACWRPDDGVFVYFIATGDEKADAILLNRVMTSVRDYGKMPVTDFKR